MHKSILCLVSLGFLVAGCSDSSSANGIPKKEEGFFAENRRYVTATPMYLEAHYFNDVTEVDGYPTIMNPENIAANVNKDYRLPEDYRPKDLVIPNVRFPFNEMEDRRYIREDAAIALEHLFQAAEQEGLILYAISGFRSYERQDALYQEALAKQGLDQDLVAKPGHSEHQTGLAMDISSAAMNHSLHEGFAETAEGIWVAQNAHLFGFIIRYPKGKEDMTGYNFEPWHLRYVGDLAKDIYEQAYSFEEYLQIVKKM